MSDGRSKRKAKVIPFIGRLDRDRKANFAALVQKAKLLQPEGLENVDWDSPVWQIKKGRLAKSTGRNVKSVSLNFRLPPSLGSSPLNGEWGTLIKSLTVLRYHRKRQALENVRQFIFALGYVYHAQITTNQDLTRLTPETLDHACALISQHYKESTAYNMHKYIAEFSAYCDVNGLCRTSLQYRYHGMKRPDIVSGLGYKRLDNPSIRKTESERVLAPELFKTLGELYQNVPKDHKYRFYVLCLCLFACTGRRFTEITLLPYQDVQKDSDGCRFLEYFPRKMSKGDVFTPRRKLPLPSDVGPIVEDVINELKDLSSLPRATAEQMQKVQGPDLRFLNRIDYKTKLYTADLIELGFHRYSLNSNGWLRKNGYAKADHKAVTRLGTKPAYPLQYTTRVGLEAYCAKDFNSSLIDVIHIDQQGKKYFLKDLLMLRYIGLSSGAYSKWISTFCTPAMFTTFRRYFPKLVKEFTTGASASKFSSHDFRHTLNTLLDEGGLSDLLQSEWFGRSNPQDTKAYQHVSREKRALLLREDIKKGIAQGDICEQMKFVPVEHREVFLKVRVKSVLDVGPGICIHEFSQTPCERQLQCSAECKDYVWIKGDEGRVEELKRQYALTSIARETALNKSKSGKPKLSIDWLHHNEKKLKVLNKQLKDNGITEFDPDAYLKGTEEYAKTL